MLVIEMTLTWINQALVSFRCFLKTNWTKLKSWENWKNWKLEKINWKKLIGKKYWKLDKDLKIENWKNGGKE